MEIPSILGVLGTDTEELLQGLEDLKIRGRVKAMQTTALLTYLEDSWRFQEIFCHSDSNGKPSDNAGVKNTQTSKMIIIR